MFARKTFVDFRTRKSLIHVCVVRSTGLIKSQIHSFEDFTDLTPPHQMGDFCSFKDSVGASGRTEMCPYG